MSKLRKSSLLHKQKSTKKDHDHDPAGQGTHSSKVAAVLPPPPIVTATIKPEPQQQQRFREKFPHLDWALLSKVPLHDYISVMENCKKHIEKSPKALGS